LSVTTQIIISPISWIRSDIERGAVLGRPTDESHADLNKYVSFVRMAAALTGRPILIRGQPQPFLAEPVNVR